MPKKRSHHEFIYHKTNALEITRQRLAHFNKTYQFKIHKITIRNQMTRWGSCSKKGNLNFNYRIILLPMHLLDYVIVHELCHLKEFNHSKHFWDLVAKILPDYKKVKKEFKKIRFYK